MAPTDSQASATSEKKDKEEGETEKSSEPKEKFEETVLIGKRFREFFVKWQDMSHWHCSWVSEIEVIIFTLSILPF